jgi:uncharacterized protein
MEKLAVVGTGIAGMSCIHFLKDRYEITVFEKNGYAGGHTNTVTVNEDGKPVHIDTGFMVFNHVTYPLLTRLFADLNIPTNPTEMSFSVQHHNGLEYSGSGLNGLFAQRKNIFSPGYIRMLLQISRFNKTSVGILDDPKYDNYTLKDYITEQGFGSDMLYKYLIPMSSAVWSTPINKMLDFPAKTLVRFFHNHGFLGLDTQHQWYTVTGGSRIYRDKIMGEVKASTILNDDVKKVIRVDNAVKIITKSGREMMFDKVILAAHADESLAMLENPGEAEQKLLSPFKYQYNSATLHTDTTQMPKLKRVWSSWNYKMETDGEEVMASTIYWMNSLQQVSKKKDYFVTINDHGGIHPEKVILKIDYTHPLFDVNTANAQKNLQMLNEKGPVYFCGSYFRYGFHEDALLSGVLLSRKLSGKNIYGGLA